VNELLKKDIEMNSYNNEGDTSLLLAIKNEFHESVKNVIKKI
jgi:ankyrin repeat protein